ncbi:hypothetical protein ROZALSC1DRAFT_28024, partial [Rozella allomycis CSF55]
MKRIKSYANYDNVVVDRPKYRNGKILTAVKSYTVCDESRYLYIDNVPSYNVFDELIKLFSLHGDITEYKKLETAEARDKFSDVALLKFENIEDARNAKISLDDEDFYGCPLNVRYAPEFESIEEIEDKLKQRKDCHLMHL